MNPICIHWGTQHLFSPDDKLFGKWLFFLCGVLATTLTLGNPWIWALIHRLCPLNPLLQSKSLACPDRDSRAVDSLFLPPPSRIGLSPSVQRPGGGTTILSPVPGCNRDRWQARRCYPQESCGWEPEQARFWHLYKKAQLVQMGSFGVTRYLLFPCPTTSAGTQPDRKTLCPLCGAEDMALAGKAESQSLSSSWIPSWSNLGQHCLVTSSVSK